MADTVYSQEYVHMVQTLRLVRTELGLFQDDLGKRVGKDQTYISNIERGQRRIDIWEFYRLALAMGVEPTELYQRVTRCLPEKFPG